MDGHRGSAGPPAPKTELERANATRQPARPRGGRWPWLIVGVALRMSPRPVRRDRDRAQRAARSSPGRPPPPVDRSPVGMSLGPLARRDWARRPGEVGPAGSCRFSGRARYFRYVIRARTGHRGMGRSARPRGAHHRSVVSQPDPAGDRARSVMRGDQGVRRIRELLVGDGRSGPGLGCAVGLVRSGRAGDVGRVCLARRLVFGGRGAGRL